MAGPTTRFPRQSALRRYPALVWLVAAGMMALLLPSGLTLPQSGPPTLAEYAPVPGAADGSGDLGQLGTGPSSGVGAGGGGGSPGNITPPSADEPAAVTGRFVRKAGTKRCVGSPGRQTEDPLSPPCIAFFEGDNGGATAKGVTKDEVVVTAAMDATASDPKQGEVFDCTEAIDPEETFQDTLCKAYTRYFNNRYQTYGRTVRLLSEHALTPAAIEERFHPFAHVAQGASSSFSKQGTLSVGYGGALRTSYAKYAPLLVTFRPDYEDMIAMTASYVCQRLIGRPARFAGDPLLRSQTRKIALWREKEEVGLYERMLLESLSEQCGLKPTLVFGTASDQTTAARLRTDNVTSVIIVVGNTSHALVTQQATRSGFFPEWIVPGLPDFRTYNTNFYGRLADQSQWANAFGVSLDYRRNEFTDQPWYRAYKEGCPTCPEPQAGAQGVTVAAAMYDAISMLFYGIQSAGPRLTAENIDRGLHAIPPRRSQDPFLPAAYFGPGNWSFVKDATAMWWDPSGVAPGSSVTGCYRLPNGGLRFRAGEWPTSDDDVKAAGPCQGDTVPGG